MKTYPHRPYCPLSTQIDFPVVRLVVSNAFVPVIITVHDRLDGKIGDNELRDVLTSAADCWYLEGDASHRARASLPEPPSSNRPDPYLSGGTITDSHYHSANE